MATYRVVADTSTRASPDPASPDFESWVHFRHGQKVTAWPDHAPVDEWVASGHWAPIAERGTGEQMVGTEVPLGKSATLTQNEDGTGSVVVHDDDGETD